ncbi:MAG: nucleotidyltransferase domain-containing protein [Clostridiales bacterium]|nr:nucleotidyltransferase domain-containing protein [Clostridiales bacterium]MCF8021738.1 nucleotidyltransferase domain-containing protein [Clostridiales bacterium]
MGNMINRDIKAVTEQVNGALSDFHEVAGAYLFGSTLEMCRPDSDVDVGIIPVDFKLSEKERVYLESKILNCLNSSTGFSYDIVVLNLDNIIFSFRVIKEGCLIYSNDPDRVRDFIEQVSRIYAEVYPRYRRALEEILDEVPVYDDRS